MRYIDSFDKLQPNKCYSFCGQNYLQYREITKTLGLPGVPQGNFSTKSQTIIFA